MNRPMTADSMWAYSNGVLKNKFNIENMEELNQKELEIINDKLVDLKPIKEFNKESFLNLHYYLFNELYDFAGKIRDENVVYNEIMMCSYQVIDLCLTDLFDTYIDIRSSTTEDLTEIISYLYSELSVILPFRDGNEITIQTFLEMFASNQNYKISFKEIDKDILHETLIDSFYHDTDKLKELFIGNIKKQS